VTELSFCRPFRKIVTIIDAAKHPPGPDYAE
jgi:hypothetical protein